jgi:cobalamin biosynthetic protein CobC
MLYPEAPMPWIDLSTGINPSAYPMDQLPTDALTRLPSGFEVRRLEEIAARAYSATDPDRVIAVPGSQALIQLLPRLRPPGQVAILGPTYDEHRRSWERAGHRVTLVETLAAALTIRPDVVVVVNPNNPDGRIIAPEVLAAAAADLNSRQGWLVIDEAFADLEDGVSLAPMEVPNAIILRSFGKAYGLAGLRLGFAVIEPAFGARLRAEFGSWAVSGPAIVFASAALADRAWLSRQKTELGRSAVEFDAMLTQAGFRVVGGTRLFRLAWHEEAASWFQRLACAGIWVRKFDFNTKLLRFGNPGASAPPRLARILGIR